MWAKLMDTKNAYTAELWKELLNGEALSVRVVPASGWANASELGAARDLCAVGEDCTWRRRS